MSTARAIDAEPRRLAIGGRWPPWDGRHVTDGTSSGIDLVRLVGTPISVHPRSGAEETGPMVAGQLVVSLAGILNRQQDKVLEYLLAENKVLKEQLKASGGRLRFTDKQRRLLAAKARAG